MSLNEVPAGFKSIGECLKFLSSRHGFGRGFGSARWAHGSSLEILAAQVLSRMHFLYATWIGLERPFKLFLWSH